MARLTQRGRHEAAVERPDTDVAYGKELIAQGRWAEAESYLGDLLARRQEALAADDPRINGARVAYGAALLALRRDTDALAVFSAAVAEARRLHGDRHPVTLAVRVETTDALITTGRLAEAENEARSLVHAYDGIPLGVQRSATQRVRAHTQLIKVLSAAGRVREAIDVSDALLPKATGALGAHHPFVLVCRVNRVQHLALLGRFDEAEREAADLASIAAQRTAAGDPNAAAIRLAVANGLAFSWAECGRFAEAEQHVRAPLAEAEQLLGASSDFAQALRLNLVTALVGQGRHEEALAEAEPLPVRSSAQPGSRALARAEALYGLTLLAESEAAAHEALAEATPRLAPIHHRILRTRSLLALVHHSPEEMRAVAAAWSEHFGPDHPRTRAAWAALG